MMVEDNKYAVMTHMMWSAPSSAPTIVGNAVDSTVWLKEAKSITSMSAEKINHMVRLSVTGFSVVSDTELPDVRSFFTKIFLILTPQCRLNGSRLQPQKQPNGSDQGAKSKPPR